MRLQTGGFGIIRVLLPTRRILRPRRGFGFRDYLGRFRLVEKIGEGTPRGRTLFPLADERALRELREIWDRGNSSDNSARSIAAIRRAFLKACAAAEGGADEIVAAARVCRAAAEASDGVWFLRKLVDWLQDEGWTRPPPVKPKRQRSGRPERRGSSTHMMRTALKFGGYCEDEHGNLYYPDGMQGSSIYWRANQ